MTLGMTALLMVVVLSGKDLLNLFIESLLVEG